MTHWTRHQCCPREGVDGAQRLEDNISVHALAAPRGCRRSARSSVTDVVFRAALRLSRAPSATDPYQPAETRIQITRQLLGVFRTHPVNLLVIQTRSPLVERDFDIIEMLPFACLSMTVETNDDAVRKAWTPACPALARRLDAMRRARQRGIKVQAAVSSVLPHNRTDFVDLLSDAADRVVIDTFSGDGAMGARTQRRPLPSRYIELGWGDWQNEAQAVLLREALVGRIGGNRVAWSSDGFNNL